jgi:hypothetical protein
LVSKTDPDSSPMKRKDSKGSHLGYYAHYVVDGGKARIILNALVTPFEVTENQPMLDLLWCTSFRYKLRPKRVTGDTAYGTIENIAAVERMGIRAYVPLTGAGKARTYFSKMHEERERPGGPALLRRGLRRSGKELLRHLRLREGPAQTQSVGRADVRRGQRLARSTQIQTTQATEGEHRGANDRRRAEY